MTPQGFADKVAFVWKVADKLRGTFKQHEYGSVMLPLLVLRLGQFATEQQAPEWGNALRARLARPMHLVSSCGQPVLALQIQCRRRKTV